MLMPQMWVNAQSDTVNWTYYCSCDTDLHFNNAVIGSGDAAEREETADGAQKDIFGGSVIWTWRIKKKTLCTLYFFHWWGMRISLILQLWDGATGWMQMWQKLTRTKEIRDTAWWAQNNAVTLCLCFVQVQFHSLLSKMYFWFQNPTLELSELLLFYSLPKDIKNTCTAPCS